jgi:ribonuclease HI
MHLAAVVEGLRALKRPVRVRVYTASGYVRDGATRWLDAWRERAWKTKEGKPVEHRDLWEALDDVQRGHTVEWPVLEGAESPDLEAAKTAARSAVAPPASAPAGQATSRDSRTPSTPPVGTRRSVDPGKRSP